jgi:NADH-quinone oxidoreductase subunit M
MTELSVPVLSVIIFLPILAAVIILLLPRSAVDLVKGVALTTALACFLLGLVVYTSYNGEVGALAQEQAAILEAGESDAATQTFSATLAYVERVDWVPALGISYHVGVDGLSAPMVLLTGMVFLAGVLVSWRIEDRVREFMAFFLLLVAGVYGVFLAMDLFLLFFFYELAIFPMYLLIATYGWVKLREYAAMKLTLYILIGSVVALIGVIAMVLTASNFFQSPEGAVVLENAIAAGLLPANAQPFSFDVMQLTLAAEHGAFSVMGYAGIDTLSFARLWFPFIFLGFAVLAGVFPFHNWSPDGHVAAPTAVSMIHAGVLMKLGAYAALRVGVQLLPSGAEVHLPWIVLLATVNVIYGALIAFRQRDFKYVIGFSSVSHMGLVTLGWATMNLVGFTGAGLQMFSHGVMTALFFGCVGMVYERAHTRDIPSLGGFSKVMPWVAFAFILGGLASMGMPGFSGFIAELPIFMGLFQASPEITLQVGNATISNYYSLIAIIAILGVVITAAYVLRVTSQVFFGPFDRAKYADVTDITIRERFVLVFLGAPLIILGLAPMIMAPMLQVGVAPVLALLGGGT